MAESLKEVIAKLKAQQNSQTSKPAELPKPEKVEEIEEEEDDFEEEEETPVEDKTPVKAKETPEEQSAREQVLMEIELLQNDGRYRVELLHQLQELNKALVVIAGALVDLNGKGK